MGWETTLYTSLHFNRKTYDSKYQVEDELEELNESINRYKQELRDLVMITEPEKMFKSSDDTDEYTTSPYDTVTGRFKDLMEFLEEDLIEKYKLEILLDSWDACHDKKSGLAIGRPDNVKWDSSFMDGDFIKTVQKPDLHDSIFEPSTSYIANSDNEESD